MTQQPDFWSNLKIFSVQFVFVARGSQAWGASILFLDREDHCNSKKTSDVESEREYTGRVPRSLFCRLVCLHLPFPTVIEFLKKYCAKGSAWPRVDLRLCPWLPLFKYWRGMSGLSSSLCPYRVNMYLQWKPISERKRSSDQFQSVICVVIHRGEWKWIEWATWGPGFGRRTSG
jgi:hypothetical protein